MAATTIMAPLPHPLHGLTSTQVSFKREQYQIASGMKVILLLVCTQMIHPSSRISQYHLSRPTAHRSIYQDKRASKKDTRDGAEKLKALTQWSMVIILTVH